MHSVLIVDAKTIGKRIAAARKIADLTRPELAQRLDLPGLGEKTIGNIERGTRELRPHEYAPLAQALQVPAEFLTGPNNEAGAPIDLQALNAKLDHVIANQTRLLEEFELVFKHRSAQGTQIIDRLDALEAHLTEKTDELLPGIRELLGPEVRQAPVPGPKRSAAAKS